MTEYSFQLSADLDHMTFTVHLGIRNKTIKEYEFPIPSREEVLALGRGDFDMYFSHRLKIVTIPRELFVALDEELMKIVHKYKAAA